MKLLLLFLGVICYRKAASAPAAEKTGDEEELTASLPLVLTDKALEGGANELLAEPLIKILPYLGEEKAKALKELGENYQHTAVKETNGPEAQILPKPIAVGEPNGGKKIDFSLDGFFYKGKKKIASYRIDFKGVLFKKQRDEENPCNLIDCKEGTVCELQEMACIPGRKCPPQPECVPIKNGPSCKTIKCMANHTCLDLPTGSTCVPIGESPCKIVDCKEGTVCKLREVNCIKAPCPPQPECVPVNNGPSCKTIKCMANHTCMDLPSGSKCVPGEHLTCSAIECRVGLVCQMEEVACIRAPCPPPVHKCVSPSPNGPTCETIKCSVQYYCADLPSGSQCVHFESDACDSANCKEGTVCKLQERACMKAPCPPLFKCLPANGPSCMTVKCSSTTRCVETETGPVCQPIDGATTTVGSGHETTEAIKIPVTSEAPVKPTETDGATPAIDLDFTRSAELPVTSEQPVQSTGKAALVCPKTCPPGTTCIKSPEGPACGVDDSAEVMSSAKTGEPTMADDNQDTTEAVKATEIPVTSEAPVQSTDPADSATGAVDDRSSTPAASDSGTAYTGLPPKPEFGPGKCSPGLVFAWNEKAARCLANGTQVCTEEDWEKVKGNTFGACMKNAPKIAPADNNEKTDCGLGKVYAQVPGEPTAELYGRRCADAFCPKEGTCVQEKTAAHCCIMPRWAHYGK